MKVDCIHKKIYNILGIKDQPFNIIRYVRICVKFQKVLIEFHLSTNCIHIKIINKKYLGICYQYEIFAAIKPMARPHFLAIYSVLELNAKD